MFAFQNRTATATSSLVALTLALCWVNPAVAEVENAGEAPVAILIPPVPPEAAPATFSVTVRAGERVSDFCKRLEKTRISGCTELDALGKNKGKFQGYAFLGSATGLKRFEGAFVPGQYRFLVQHQEEDSSDLLSERIVSRLLAIANSRFTKLTRTGLSLREKVILASVVEKEAVSKTSHGEIASVFMNRLTKRQPLGSCPTVEYALGYHRPFLLFSDVRIDSPYNVYKRKGLPPTPIAFFSDEAWNAVQSPPKTRNEFFVYDWTNGKVSFARTYGEHTNNANRARRNFVQKFGYKKMYEKVPGKFYE
ncbi:MAG: endolytic transglycosylase MltG [Leptospirales bacterium]|nr:endolytic transglycosylase MltG [Leptospirales bacterium]